MKNKVHLILFLTLVVMGCKNRYQEKIQMIYTIDQFDYANDKMNVIVTIENNSLLDLKGGEWELHWNQMKGFVQAKSLAEGLSLIHI